MRNLQDEAIEKEVTMGKKMMKAGSMRKSSYPA
jgi:hypothetical protein